MSHDADRTQGRHPGACPLDGRTGPGVRDPRGGLVRIKRTRAAAQPAGEGGAGGAAPRKYRNQRTVVDGITFDSKREAQRWHELCLVQRAGIISNLRRQVAFELAPGVKFAGAKRAQPALRLIVDFTYRDEHGQQVLEDVKGVVTTAFTIKRHLLKAVHGLEVRLIR